MIEACLVQRSEIQVQIISQSAIFTNHNNLFSQLLYRYQFNQLN